MRAMVLQQVKTPLTLQEIPPPLPQAGEIQICVHVCGVCRTDLHVVDGELPSPKLPLIPGHQIVGHVTALGEQVSGLALGMRVGVPWLGGTCGHCRYCLSDQENLCDHALYTGYQKDGGFAEYCIANAHFVLPLPSHFTDLEVAPLLCAGLIGYRALRMTKEAQKIGFYGFGSSAHLMTQVACYQKKEIYAFTRTGDVNGQAFARSLGAVWAGNSTELPPAELDAAIIFAPDGSLIPLALRAVRKGGVVVCAGIHMSDIPAFPYRLLWEERQIRSVANLTRRDGREFLALAPHIPLHSTVTPYPLERANDALDDLRHGRFSGAAVIVLKG